MGNRLFTPEQIEDLLRNPNVTKCSDKSISYSGKFKDFALKQNRQDGIPAKHVFIKAGFDLGVIGRKTPKQCISRWRRTVRLKGEDTLMTECRGKSKGGGRPKTTSMSDAERIEMLEATVAYLKAEKQYLMKLRAQRKS